MSNPDVVQHTLDLLSNNWDTNNYSPVPTLIDGDEMRLNSGGRARETDVMNTNIITVNSGPETTNEAIGTEFDFRVRLGTSVEIEGYHEDGGGQITDKDDFDSLVTEARRAILLDREFPVGDLTWLTIESENDLSSAETHNKANYFRYTFDVWYMGYESLP